MKAEIEVKDLTKTYVNKKIRNNVLYELSFKIYKGESVAIVGKSGTGKSTLLYQIGLLDYPTSGQINIFGKNTNILSDTERTQFRLDNFGFIFQNYALLPELTAIENVMLPNIMRGIAKNKAYEMSKIALEKVGLLQYINKYTSELSGGENQRISIARAISNNPKIIFADEVTANLDEVTSESILELFFKINKGGLTFVMITHELDYAKLCDRVLCVSNHKIEEITKKKRL